MTPLPLRERLLVRALLALTLKVSGAASGLLATLVMARLMDIGEFGLTAFLTSLLTLAATLALLGHEPLLVRELPHLRLLDGWGELRGLLRHAAALALGLSLLIGLAGTLAVLLGAVPATQRSAWLAALLTLPLLVAFRLAGAFLQGMGRVLVGDFVAQSFVQLAVLAALLLAAALGTRLEAGSAMGLRLAASLAVAAGGIALAFALLHAAPAGAPLARTRHWLSEAPPYAVLMVALFLISECDTLIVKLIAGNAAAGLYRPPQRIVWAISFGLMAVNTLMQPRVARLATAGREGELQEAVSESVRLSLVLTVPAILAVVGLAGPLLGLFGEAYREGATALRVLALGQLVNTAMGPVALLLNMTGHQRTTLRLTLLVVALNAVLCVALTESLGVVGAAAATAFSMALWNVLLWRAVRLRLDIRPTVLAPGVWHVRPIGAAA